MNDGKGMETDPGSKPPAPNGCLMKAWSAHERELRGWFRRRLDDPADADDLLQELFLKALRQRERFCAILNARAWLFEVARNALADRLRVARPLVELPPDLPALGDETPVVGDLAACLPRVLSELSPEDRDAIRQCDLDGMPQADYARRMGLSLPGAKARVQRARKRLRERLALACQVRWDEAGQVSDFRPRPPSD